MSALVSVPRGTLPVTAPLGLGQGALLRSIVNFLERQPDLGVELTLSDRTVDLIAEGFDAAIRIGHLPDSGLIARTLASYRVVTCASPAYLERRGVPPTAEDLKAHGCLDYIFSQRPAPRLWSFTKGDQTAEMNLRARLVINDGRSLVEAALAGFGIICVGEMKISEHLSKGRLLRVLGEYDNPSRPLQVVFASHRLQVPKLRVFIDSLAAAFAAV